MCQTDQVLSCHHCHSSCSSSSHCFHPLLKGAHSMTEASLAEALEESSWTRDADLGLGARTCVSIWDLMETIAEELLVSGFLFLGFHLLVGKRTAQLDNCSSLNHWRLLDCERKESPSLLKGQLWRIQRLESWGFQSKYSLSAVFGSFFELRRGLSHSFLNYCILNVFKIEYGIMSSYLPLVLQSVKYSLTSREKSLTPHYSHPMLGIQSRDPTANFT